jgi:hypothetical protein
VPSGFDAGFVFLHLVFVCIRINDGICRDNDCRYKDEYNGIGSGECAEKAFDAGKFEQFPAGLVCLLPDRFAAQRPGGADAHEPVRFRMLQKEPGTDEEDAKEDRKRDVHVHRVRDVPEDHQGLNDEQVQDEDKDETLVIVPELFKVLSERIDTGQYKKECHAGDHDEGDDSKPRQLVYRPVCHSQYVPVRGKGRGEQRVESNRHKQRYDDTAEMAYRIWFIAFSWELSP